MSEGVRNLFPSELLIFSTFWKINLLKNKKILYITKFMYAVVNFISHNTKIETQLPLWATQIASEKPKEHSIMKEILKHWTHCHNMPHSHYVTVRQFTIDWKNRFQKQGLWTLEHTYTWDQYSVWWLGLQDSFRRLCLTYHRMG